MTQNFTCPRRVELGMHDPSAPFHGSGSDLDNYAEGHGLVGQGRGCTFCGSMHPEDFLEAIRDGAELEPTDKNYKAYVQGYKADGSNGAKFYFQHLDAEQRGEFIRLLNAGKIRFGYPGQFYVLPYFLGVQLRGQAE